MEGNWTDAQEVSALMSSSLLVADVAEGEIWDLYAMAHARFVPTIRLAHSAVAAELPRLLRGHPYGYQADLVRWSSVDDLAKAITERASAMRDTRRVIDDYEVGRDFLERRRFPQQHHVFISHNLKGKDREVIKGIVKALKERSITSWEYGDHNRSGDKWRVEMDKARREKSWGQSFAFMRRKGLTTAISERPAKPSMVDSLKDVRMAPG